MNNQDHNHDAEPFGPVIYSYTRKQAVADGVQVEVTKTAAESGIKFPVFLTRTVFDTYVAVPPDVAGQDEAGRLWDIVWMLRFVHHSGLLNFRAHNVGGPPGPSSPSPSCDWFLRTGQGQKVGMKSLGTLLKPDACGVLTRSK